MQVDYEEIIHERENMAKLITVTVLSIAFVVIVVTDTVKKRKLLLKNGEK